MLVAMGACKKQPPPQPPPPKPIVPSTTLSTNLEIVWNAPFHSDSTEDWFWDYVIADDEYIVLANIFERSYNKPRGIGVYNMRTGERHPVWKNDPGGIFEISESEDLADCKVAGKNKDIILIYNYFNLFAYNLHSGQRMWKVSIPANTYGRPKMSAQGDNAFITYGRQASRCSLAVVDVYSGAKRDVLQLEIEDNYEFEINPPFAYVTATGDTLLFFTTDALNFATLEGRGYTYCYNMTKKQMVWVNKPLTTDRMRNASSAQPPPYIIENDKLIVTTRTAIYCLNQHTGELIWQKEDVWLTTCPPLYYEGKIYIRSGSGNPTVLLCLDAQSGQMLWENATLNPIPAFNGAMAVYKDRLYFSASRKDVTNQLVCVDIHTGSELWSDKGPHGNIAFGVLIDQETGYLYCNTGWSTMCVDLNKTPK